jgi:hypothetical protein
MEALSHLYGHPRLYPRRAGCLIDCAEHAAGPGVCGIANAGTGVGHSQRRNTHRAEQRQARNAGVILAATCVVEHDGGQRVAQGVARRTDPAV